MPREVELAILFADVSDSTRLYETLGDVAARAIIADCLERMTTITHRHGGLLARTIGDEVLSTFPSADVAAEAAMEMQDTITGRMAARGRSVMIRIGFHFGPALVDGSDVHGDAVNVAARVAAQAKAGQILTTAAAHGRMGVRQASTRPVARSEVRGKRGYIDVYEVIWQEEEVTMMHLRPRFRATAFGAGPMILSAGAGRLELGEDRRVVTAGRDERNDLVLNDITVSRIHARIEYRNGRFLLVDLSANGTFIEPHGGTSAFVHRDSAELSGSGLLGLGARPAPGSLVTIRYERG